MSPMRRHPSEFHPERFTKPAKTRFVGFGKSFKELCKISAQIKCIYNKENPLEVDIERTIEAIYGLIIDILPLKRTFGIHAILNLSSNTIHVDPDLADLDRNVFEYRFALAEALAHFIIHKSRLKGYDLEQPTKLLAGMILSPSSKLVLRRNKSSQSPGSGNASGLRKATPGH
jgi:hypothetical protein